MELGTIVAIGAAIMWGTRELSDRLKYGRWLLHWQVNLVVILLIQIVLVALMKWTR